MIERHSPISRRRFLQITAVSAAVSGVALAAGRWPFGRPPASLSETRLLMGTLVNLTVVGGANGRSALNATFSEMERLIALFDHRRPETPLARLNQTGRLVNPPAELVDVLTLANQYSALTAGAFDASVKPLLDAYQAGRPDAASYRHLVNYRQIAVSPDEIRLGQPGMALTLDGIAKGRVVDGGTAVLLAHDFPNVLVEAGGDLLALGARADGRPWLVGLNHPRQAAAAPLRTLPISQRAAATSGDYQHSFSQDFRQHHILDPRTGLSPTDLASATVLAPTAADADALSTTLMVLGAEAGLALMARLPHIEALVVTKEMEIRQTAGFPQ
jgi:FAD:protein FMN transferase